VISFLLAWVSGAWAGETNVSLAWDPSSDSGVIGYNIYYGNASGSYSQKVAVGNVTATTISGLTVGLTYYFAATAVNAEGLESEYSNEAVFQSGTIEVNNPPTLDAISSISFREGVAGHTVALTGIGSGDDSSQSVTVTVSSSNPSLVPAPYVSRTDATSSTASLVFAACQRGTATISVTVDDGQASNNTLTRTFDVTVTSAENLPPTFDSLPDITIAENSDTQTVQITGISAGEGESQPIEVYAVCYNLALITSPVITYTSPNSTATLTFKPVPYANGTVTVLVSVYDGQSQNNFIRKSFNVNIVPVNQTPTLDPISNISITPDVAETTVQLSGISSGQASENQTLTVSAVSSNPSLVANPRVTYTSPATTGTLTFSQAANGAGTAVVSVTVNDGGELNNTITRTFTVTVTGGNQAPTLDAISDVTVLEETGTVAHSLKLSGIGTGAASEDQPLTITARSRDTSLVSDPIISYATPNSTAWLMFTPVPYASGSCIVDVTVNDGQPVNNVVVRSFKVTVQSVNQAPTLNVIQNVSMDQNASPKTISLTGIGSGAPNENETLSVVAISSNQSLIPNPVVNYSSPATSGSLQLSPVRGAYGSAIISVTVNDGNSENGTVTRMFTVTVGAGNRPPTLDALADVTIPENAPEQTITLTGISCGAANENQSVSMMAFSSDPGLLPDLRIDYVSPATEGTLSFTPAPNTVGTATITVLADDAQSTNGTVARTFQVTVVPVNRPPTVDPIAAVSVDENTGLLVVTVTGIGTGGASEEQNITVTASSSDTLLVPKPVVSYTSPSSTAWLSLSPKPYAYGTCTITVTVSDGQATNGTTTRSFEVTINSVNQPPTLNSIDNLVLDQNSSAQTVVISGINSGAPNEDQTLTIRAISSNPTLIPNPYVSYSSPAASGLLIVSPVAGQFGTSIVTVTVDDGAASDNLVTRAFTVTVGATNRPPTLDAIADVNLQENSGQQTLNLTGISPGADYESQVVTVKAVSSNPGLIPTPGITYTAPGASAKLVFTPVANAFGSATITVTVDDGQSTVNTVSRSFKVTVTPLNRAPTLDAVANLTIDEGSGEQVVELTGITPGAAHETQTVSISAVSSDDSLIPSPAVEYPSTGTTGWLKFTPKEYAFGACTITVTLNDGQSLNNLFSRAFVVTVSPVNQQPTLSAIPDVTVQENAPQQSLLLSGISSGAPNEEQALTVTASSSNPELVPHPTVEHTGDDPTALLRFQPVPGGFGEATVTVTVSDGATQNGSVSRSFKVSISSANRPPTLDLVSNVTVSENAGTSTIRLSGISCGATNENQVLTITAKSSNPSVVPNPTISYENPKSEATLSFKPASGIFGTARITVVVHDGQSTDNTVERTFVVTVQPYNRPPTLDPIATLTVDENAPEQIVQLTGLSSGADFEQQGLVVTASSSNPSLIPTPTVTYSSPSATALLRLTPQPFAFGSCTVTVRVSDGQTTNSVVERSFAVVVNAINQVPTLDYLLDLAIEENSGAQTVALTGIGSGMSNEVQVLVVTATSSNPALIPAPAVVYTSPNTSGALNFQPTPGAFGSTVIAVTVNDGGLTDNTVTRSFTVTVGPVNRPPTLDPITDVALLENSTTNVSLTGIGAGAAFEQQTVKVTARSSNPSVLPNPQVNYTAPATVGSLILAPVKDTFGTVIVTVTVDDGQATSGVVSRSFRVKIGAVNRPPTIAEIEDVVIQEDASPQTVLLSGITVGASYENQPLLVRAMSQNPEIIPDPVVLHAGQDEQGSLTLTPVSNAVGTALITVVVEDGQAVNGSSSRTFQVVVEPRNDAPTLDPLPSHVIWEDSGTKSVTLSGIGSGATNEFETVAVTATSSNPSLIPAPSIQYRAGDTEGTLAFAPVKGAFGRATISVTVDDGQQESNTFTRSFIVDVLPVNRPPTLDALSDLVLMENAGQMTVGLTGISSGRDSENQSLTITTASSNPNLIPAPAVSYKSPAASGALLLHPVPNASGNAIITVFVNDGASTANMISRSFTVTVKALNRAPTLDPISNLELTQNDGSQLVALTGISCGALGENQTVRISAYSSDVSVVPHPEVAYDGISSQGSLLVKPSVNANGVAVITVVVDDGQATANTVTRSFVVSVRAFNHPPTLDGMADVSLPENANMQEIPLTGISSGAANEDQTLQVTAVSSNPNLLIPVVKYSSPDNRGTLQFIPTPFAVGTARITVTVNDGQSTYGIVTRSFQVTVYDVNQPPTLDVLENVVLSENSGPQFIPLTGISSGSPNESQTLSITAISSNPTLIPTPSVNYTNPSATGMLVFHAVPNSSGESMMTVKVNDGASSNNIVVRKFRVIIAPVNQRPTLNPLLNLTLNENPGPQTITLGGLSSGAADESQLLIVTAFSSRPDIIPHPVVSYTSPNSWATLSFTPVQNANGTAVITVAVDDGQPENGTTTRSFTITVNPVNQAPTLDVISAFSVQKNTPELIVPLSGITSGAANEDQTLSVSATSSTSGLVISSTVSYVSPQTVGSLRMLIASNVTGSATITVSVSDGQAVTSRAFLLAVGVGGAGGFSSNTPPTLLALSPITIKENAGTQRVTLSGIAAGTGPENQPLTITASSSNPSLIANPIVEYASPASTGTLIFTPSTNAYGSAVITIAVDDGQVENNVTRRTFTVTVTPVNQPPTLNPISSLTLPRNSGPKVINLSGISSGAANELQAVTITARSSNPSVLPNPAVTYKSGNATGTLTLTPVSETTGTATVTVTLSDGQAQNSTFERTFEVVIGDENITPTLDPISPIVIGRNSPAQTVQLTGISSGSSAEGQCVVITATSSDPSVIPNPQIQYVSPECTGKLTIVPVSGASGTVEITVKVDDGQATNNVVTRSLTVTIGDPSATFELGSAFVMADQTNNVPVVLSTTLGATNVSFKISLVPGVLTNLQLEGFAPEVDSSKSMIISQTPSNCQVRLVARAGQTFAESLSLARLAFKGVGPHSGRTTWNISETAVTFASGSCSAAKTPSSGEVVVIGVEPLVQNFWAPDGQRGMVIYGKPGASYSVEWSTNVSATAIWNRLPIRLGFTNCYTRITLPDTELAQIFYRAVEFQANPPVLEIGGNPNGKPALTVFGQPGSSYTVQMSTSLRSSSWTNVMTIQLTNSFQKVEVPAAGPVSLFRLRRD
jgi:hypothetical protein